MQRLLVEREQLLDAAEQQPGEKADVLKLMATEGYLLSVTVLFAHSSKL